MALKITNLILFFVLLSQIVLSQNQYSVVVVLKEDKNFINSLYSTTPNVDETKVKKAMGIYQTDKLLAELGYQRATSTEQFSLKQDYNVINGFAAVVDRQTLEMLRDHPLVEDVHLESKAEKAEESQSNPTMLIAFASLGIIAVLAFAYYRKKSVK